MKIYIVTDIEGASGLWHKSQVSATVPADHEYGKRCLVRDVNDVIDATFQQGATQVVVCDGHGSVGLIWDQVDPRAAVERPCRLPGEAPRVFPSLSNEFDSVFIIGQHAMAGTQEAFLEHTQNSREWFDFKINGQSHGEISQIAAYAGHFDVPLAFVSGDRAACRECERLFPGTVTAEVKYALQRDLACCHPRSECSALLRKRTVEAMDRIRTGKLKPWKLEKPIRLELTLQNVEAADARESLKPLSRRVGARTFQREIDDQRLVYGI